MPDIQSLLRSLKSLPGPYAPFDIEQAPATPQELFIDWLRSAIDAGIREPHAMTLSTVNATAKPDARILILKNVDRCGWHFAITRNSPKGQQISRQAGVSLTFYWSILGRQVRIRGEATDMGPEVSAADFLARPIGSRAVGLLGKQSERLECKQYLDEGLARQSAQIEKDPGMTTSNWVVYAVDPDVVEFWQGDEQRRHVRLVYERASDGWSTSRLWP
jgi:pyridoxamine 5'-phosphate oxidase